ncbi:5'-3' exoribonuclease 2 [Erysiphe necator]|nr:5'-3' exoribonuclease 2 [Erysiphe necator]
MGVPALFRWLSQKYPKIVSPVIEEQPRNINGQIIPVDSRGPNPNGEEFDNLYLDMNGIVHPCSHPEDGPVPKNEDEMMVAIFKYTDRVVKMVRPRKLLMIAIDGVAPRAKMNQQRSRRFRSAKEAKEKADDREQYLKLFKSEESNNKEPEKKIVWDSNEITPGTPFMDILAASLRYWIAFKLNTDLAWANMKVIISDSTVPGEGEHKIMEFIRSQRSSPDHNPNTRHVMYGLDADLIMLGLGTHEPNFRVLREDVFSQDSKPRVCKLCNQTGHEAGECTGRSKAKDGEFDEKESAPHLKPYIWLHVSILREYLAAELCIPNQPFKFDLERALDDWVFMCFFVGNDFLPHLPSLEIRENGIDTLIAIWRDNIPTMGGYLTKDGQVDLKRAQIILQGLAIQEDAIFRRRKQIEDRREANNKRRKLEKDRDGRGRPNERLNLQESPPKNKNTTNHRHSAPSGLPIFAPGELSKEAKALTYDMVVNRGAIYKANQANKSAAAALKSKMNANIDEKNSSAFETNIENTKTTPSTSKRKASTLEHEITSQPETPQTADDEPQIDTVRLWEEGYAERYYEQKFGADPKDLNFRHKVAKAYVEGLAWVLLYYFQGCPSWDWYYPYHYAPFAADFTEISDMEISFKKGRIFLPFEQLMGVLPAGSRQAIPKEFHHLMTSPESEIIDFYPEDFEIDLNGKKWAWQGVALLPFIDSKRLLDAMAKIYPRLPSDVAARNSVGKDVLLFAENNQLLYDEVAKNFYSKKQGSRNFKLNPKICQGLSGEIEKNDTYLPHSSLISPLTSGNLPNLDNDRSITVHYQMPKLTYTHKSMLLRGASIPPPVLTLAEVETTRDKALRSGRSYGGVPLHGDGSRRKQFNYGSSKNPQYSQSYNSYGQRSFSTNYSNNFGNNPLPGLLQSWQQPASGGYVNFGRGNFSYPPPPPPSYINRPNYNPPDFGRVSTGKFRRQNTGPRQYEPYR